MSEKAFEEEMRRINRFVGGYFPCDFCYYTGLLAMFGTCGVSLIFPRLCISDCLYYCNEELDRLNDHPESVKKGMKWSLYNGFFTSYIKIRFLLHPTNKYPKDSIYYKNLDD